MVERARAAKGDGGAPMQTVDVSKLPMQAAGVNGGAANRGGVIAAGGNPVAAAAGANIPSDPRVILQMAESAKARNELPRARALYEAAVAKNFCEKTGRQYLAPGRVRQLALRSQRVPSDLLSERPR